MTKAESHNRWRAPQLEWRMIGAIAALMVIGVTFIYSAKPASTDLPWYSEYFAKQMIWYSGGLAAAVVICLVDYSRLSRWSMVAYWAAILLLVLVLLIGTVRYGARRWISLGFFQLQPSELAKLAFIFALAHFLSRPKEELQWGSVFWKSIGLSALPFALILKEPDLGSALVFFPIGLVMMFIAGVPVRYLAKFVGAVGLVVALVLVDVLFLPSKWQVVKLEPYQEQRLLVYFGRPFPVPPDATAADRKQARDAEWEKSYNIRQALISVGSGGLFGKGWRKGIQTNLGYLPQAVAHNDFIFSVIAEEKGFIGALLVILLYALILFSGIRIAIQARDRLGTLLAVGVVTLFFCHIFINIGMNIRLMPVTGIPLPLLSYGGSSVVSSLIAAGVLQNIHLYRRAY